jgi:cytochrome c-type biogenesis protein
MTWSRANPWRATASVLLAAALVSCVEAPHRAPQIGEPAPPYRAVAINGDSVDVASLRGRVVLLNVWATWCHPCREEIPYLQRLYEQHRANGFEIAGVSVDTHGQEQEISDFVKEFGMTYPIWRDPDERIQALYLALGVPSSYLIDRSGTLRWKHLGIIRESDSTFTRALTSALGS